MQSLFLQIKNLTELGNSYADLALLSVILTCFSLFFVIFVGLILTFFEKIELGFLKKIFGLKVTLFFHNYFTFVGTIIHELSHATLCILTGAKLKEICIFEENPERLGHISYCNRGPFFIRAFQDALIASAPTFVGIFLFYFGAHKLFSENFPFCQKVIIIYFLISLLNHSSMSLVDTKAYIKSCWILIFPVFITFFITSIQILT
ncbi:MAG: M50 family metallopeptidase [Fibrobacteraceae bacterium]|nr:M50 family metallopeptidase [Fibrobacteraceae bacterium]